MYRRLLILLMLVGLLLPPGVCVCDWAQAECRDCTASHDEADETAFSGHSCRHGSSDGEHSDHLPGCPAKTGGNAWRVQPPEGRDAAAPAVATPEVRPAAVDRIVSSDGPRFHPFCSLYLVLLNLRI